MFVARYFTNMHEIWRNLQPPKYMQNGSNDFDVFNAAFDQFEKNVNPQSFSVRESIQQTEGTSQTSFDSKHSRNLDATFQQSDGRTHIDINDDSFDLENEPLLRRPVGRIKQKNRVQCLRDLALWTIFEKNLIDMCKFERTRLRL
uniref:Uncharacterized protein n=1 Tax=Lactuca sativa TaxID=4236 RepID=A0A9R1XUT9_LACSA|nr:hypothetical protein LSAT_V11C200096150 [Lactuca sativa]